MNAQLLAPRLPITVPTARRASPPAAAAPDADQVLRAAVMARLGRESWWDAATSNVYVEGGTVVLQGLVRNAGARVTARRLAESVPGVQRVWDARVVPREG